jgi:hypothetical protein
LKFRFVDLRQLLSSGEERSLLTRFCAGMEAKQQYKTALVLAEGVYEVLGSFSCPAK